MATYLFQAVLLPIVLSPVAYWLGKSLGVRSGWFTFGLMAYSTSLLLISASTGPSYSETYPWQPIGEFGLKADGLSLPFATTVAILSTVLAIYSMPYMKHRIEEEITTSSSSEREEQVKSGIGSYYMLYLLYTSGMIGTTLATNVIQFYLFFELMLIPSYFLIARFGYGDRNRISFMYFIWTHAGALLLLSGLLAIGFLAGPPGMPKFDMAAIATASIPFGLRVWVAAAIAIGLFVKLAAFGLHIWLPYAHAEAPTPISALLSPAMIGIGGYALIRFLLFVIPSAYLTTTFALSIWGVVTMIYGGLMALAQDDIKRLLAYSSISQMGYIIFGVSSAFYLGVSGSVFQYVSHGTGKAILFMVAGAIILQANGLRSISSMGGLVRKLPITATAAMIGFLTIMGTPPLNGFQAEWMLFSGSFAGAFQSGSNAKVIITAIALFSTAITAGYTLWTMKRIFFGSLPPELEGVKEASALVTIPLLFLAFLTVTLGVYPSLITERIIPMMKAAMGG